MTKDHDTAPVGPGRYPGADPDRPEPETLFQPRPTSLESFHVAARKAAQLHLLQSEKGRRRAALGSHAAPAPVERLLRTAVQNSATVAAG